MHLVHRALKEKRYREKMNNAIFLVMIILNCKSLSVCVCGGGGLG